MIVYAVFYDGDLFSLFSTREKAEDYRNYLVSGGGWTKYELVITEVVIDQAYGKNN